MAWTTDDLAAIDDAIASGVLEVRFQDRTTTYRSMDDLIKAHNLITEALASQQGTVITQYKVIPSTGF
jgi:hypothetical protein